MAEFEGLDQELLEILDFLNGDAFEQTVHTAINDSDFAFDIPGMILRLNEDLLVLTTAVDDSSGNGVDIATELGERLEFTILSLGDLKGTGDLLHTLDLGVTADTRHGDTYVDGGANTLVEEACFEEYLTIGDRDDVGRDISGDVTGLSFDDGESSERTATLNDRFEGLGEVVHSLSDLLVVDDLSGTFEETRVEIEDITGVSLTT